MSCRHGLLRLMLLMVSRLCHIIVGEEPFLKTYCILRLCKSIPFTFQKVPFQPAKGHVSACRLPSFAKQAVFVVPALGKALCCCAFHSCQHFMPYPLPYINYAVALLFFILPARKKNKFSIFVKKYPVRVMVRLPPLYAPRR